MKMQSGDECTFDRDLPTGYEESDQATPAKHVVVEKVNTEADNGKSEKKLPLLMKKSSTESEEASKRQAKTENCEHWQPSRQLTAKW